MALSKAKDLRELSDEEITAEIAKLKRDLFDLRFKKATRQIESGFHEFRHTRRKLAQLMTIETERQKAAKQKASASEKEA
ncbi:MAG: 50S ribosomal protein L29 [Phormidesmis sp.]